MADKPEPKPLSEPAVTKAPIIIKVSGEGVTIKTDTPGVVVEKT